MAEVSRYQHETMTSGASLNVTERRGFGLPEDEDELLPEVGDASAAISHHARRWAALSDASLSLALASAAAASLTARSSAGSSASNVKSHARSACASCSLVSSPSPPSPPSSWKCRGRARRSMLVDATQDDDEAQVSAEDEVAAEEERALVPQVCDRTRRGGRREFRWPEPVKVGAGCWCDCWACMAEQLLWTCPRMLRNTVRHQRMGEECGALGARREV